MEKILAIFSKNCILMGDPDSYCLVCSITIAGDVLKHTRNPKHTAKLKQTVYFEKHKDDFIKKVNDVYFCEVDGGFQCLTCNKVVSNTEISKHLDSEQHKSARVSLDCTRNNADNNYIDQRNEEKKEQMEENEANEDDTKVTSNKKVDTKVLTDNPPVTKGKAIKKLTPVSEELETYAKEHGLFVTQDRFSLNCQICSTVVPGTMNQVKKHIAGKKHTDNIKRQAQAGKELITMKMEKVLPKDYFRQTLILDCRFVIINDSFCVEFNHFFCLLDMGKIICQLCDIEIARENREMHVASPSHKFKLQKAFVITSLKEEFVRQINSLFHCGFCGVFQKDFEHMLDHLSTAVHTHQKVTKKKIFQSFKDDELNYGIMELNLYF
ncbi:unnamed protein product [Arctia plantaginis]|uniref:U1-type domain-containing protein n=1 Tax=Arctia plantaginis TaxID=874455 RepID=A0A8S0ZH51_ARCPL|nr:unnamed protein product [Arctia plantaginis]